jgi:predicted TIM-barrel enzyme
LTVHFRVSLEETGINFSSEIDMIRQAHQLDLLTTSYVFSADEAAHMGVSIGATTARSLQDSGRLIDEWSEAARRVRSDIIIIAHGGPIATPANVDYVLRHSIHCNGFYGASSVERLPVETAIVDHIKAFKNLSSLKECGG